MAEMVQLPSNVGGESPTKWGQESPEGKGKESQPSPQGKGVGIFDLEGSPPIYNCTEIPIKDSKVCKICATWLMLANIVLT